MQGTKQTMATPEPLTVPGVRCEESTVPWEALLVPPVQQIGYRAKQVSMPQSGRCQGFGGATTQIVVFRAIELKPLLPVQLVF